MLTRALLVTVCATLGSAIGSAPPTDPRVRVLPNGLTSIVQPRRGANLVAIDVWLKAGSSYERDDEKGSAHFLEHMLFRGTRRRPGGQADFEIESMGGLLNAGTTRHGAHVFVALPAASAAAAIDVIADVVRNPMLEANLMETERRVILDESAGKRNVPVHRAAEALLAAALPNDSLGRPVLGSARDITSLKLDALSGFHRRLYVPANAIAVVAGDVSVNEAHRMVERAFGDWNASTAVPGAAAPVLTRRTLGPLRAAGPGESVQGMIWTVPQTEASGGRAELEIIAEMLGARTVGSASSRPASADVTPCPGGYMLRAWWPASEPATGAALLRLIERLGATGPTDEELASARRRVQGRLLFETETVAGLARSIGDLATSEGPRMSLDFEKRLAECTRSRVRAFVGDRMAPIVDGASR